jgi:hypothetical protein
VQTVDFFTPIVDDPYIYGQIAATNALSDVYALGGRPLTAMNILGIPEEAVSSAVIRSILRGGESKVKEAGCALLGGQSIKNPEPVYGLSVTGLVHPKRLITNASARPGDFLLLTKPLGTGVVTTTIKRGVCPATLARRAIMLLRQVHRSAHHRMVIEQLHRALNRLQPRYLPRSTMGKAIGYALNQWEFLKRILDHGEAEVDNTLIENCRMHGVEPYTYLKDVLGRLPTCTNRNVNQLTPLKRKAARGGSLQHAAA